MKRFLAPHPFSMTWKDGLFIHWSVDPEELRPHVPDPLDLDTYDGRAWISLLPFVLSRAGLRWSPSFARLRFPELNLRTYVRFDGAPGLYFFSIDVGHEAVSSIVRATTRLPCNFAVSEVRTDDQHIHFRSTRDQPGEPPARFVASYQPDEEAFRPRPGTLDFWLAERRRMYDPVGEAVLYAEIAHDPWPLRPANLTVRTNTMFRGSSLPTPGGEPRVRYCHRLSMTGSIARRVRELDGDPNVRPRRLSRHPSNRTVSYPGSA